MAVSQSLTLTQISQDIATNTSQVRILWQSTQSGASYNATQKKATWWLRTNGGYWQPYYVYYTLPQNKTVTILDTTVTVDHDSTGGCILDVSTEMVTGISAGTVTLDKQLTLDTIPRYSTLTATNADIGGVSTINITKQNSGFRHSLRYSTTGEAPWTYIDGAGNRSSSEVIFSGTSVKFTVPTDFYYTIPHLKAGTCTLELWTYISDSIYLPESRKTTFTYRADPALCGPEVSCTVTDTNAKTLALTGDANTLVRYLSDARVDVVCQTYGGAGIPDESQDVSVQYMGNWYYGTALNFPGVQSDTFKLWVRDSRGYTAYGDHRVAGFIPYVRVTNQSVPERLTPTGSTVTLTISGSFYNGSFGAADNAVEVWYRIAGSQTELAKAKWYQLEPELSENGYSAQVTFNDIPYDQTRWVETWVNDKLETVTQTVKIGKGLPVFDWGENDFRFNVPVELPSLTIGGVSLADYIKQVTGG